MLDAECHACGWGKFQMCACLCLPQSQGWSTQTSALSWQEPRSFHGYVKGAMHTTSLTKKHSLNKMHSSLVQQCLCESFNDPSSYTLEEKKFPGFINRVEIFKWKKISNNDFAEILLLWHDCQTQESSKNCLSKVGII